MLRIGARDICLGVSTREVVAELSGLAEAFVRAVLGHTMRELGMSEGAKERFCILALGKLGGMELNYSSDIDLLGFLDDRSAPGSDRDESIYARLMEEVRSDLSRHTEEGYAYRVDLRLRPFGRDGELVPSFSYLIEYYGRKASLWEIQAGLKFRPIAGNVKLGYEFMENMRLLWLRKRSRDSIVKSIVNMREAAIKATRGETPDVKSGIGGLRDIEFLVQGLQLIHGRNKPHILEGNTMTGLDLLTEADILPPEVVSELKQDYMFLRRVEHYLQIMEDQQIHAIPKEKGELRALAKRVQGTESNEEQFMETLKACLIRVRNRYTEYLIKGAKRP
jgi:glutamate-ammonia-ligase adenylyltransferase